jgi:arabinofuranosyltransferase
MRQLQPSGANVLLRQVGPALLAFALYACVLYRTAWLSDDAYITYRTIDNFLHGFGLRWNITERVQAYTHPLWMFVTLAFRVLLDDMYHAALLTSALCSLAAVALALRAGNALLVFVLLVSSRAFVDFSTSGLENPLTHLLLALYVAVFLRPQLGPRELFQLTLLAALAVLNRMDALLLVLPGLTYTWLSLRTRAASLAVLAGFIPFVLWEGFSLFYYGFPFPNTAYAKLGAGIATTDLLRQGLRYLADSLHGDSITLGTTALAGLYAFLRLRGRYALLALGMALYLLYVLRIGGDFMSGRFLTAPFFLGVLLLARCPLPRHWGLWAALALLAVTCAMTSEEVPPYLTGKDYGLTQQAIPASGIADERAWYFPQTGLTAPTRRPELTEERDASARLEPDNVTQVVPMLQVGMQAYFAGPSVHALDQLALADPLLARLPALYDPHWRVGHYTRRLPEGYIASLRSGVNHLQDQALARYYDRLTLITRAPLLNRQRLLAIIRLNLGLDDPLATLEDYRSR